MTCYDASAYRVATGGVGGHTSIVRVKRTHAAETVRWPHCFTLTWPRLSVGLDSGRHRVEVAPEVVTVDTDSASSHHLETDESSKNGPDVVNWRFPRLLPPAVSWSYVATSDAEVLITSGVVSVTSGAVYMSGVATE
jgi:hypothetical protein